MSSSVKFVGSLTLSFGLYMLYNANSLSSKLDRDIRSSSLMNSVLAIVRFVQCHLSFNCAHAQLAQCRIFFSAVKGKAVLHFLQERYVVTFSIYSISWTGNCVKLVVDQLFIISRYCDLRLCNCRLAVQRNVLVILEIFDNCSG